VDVRRVPALIGGVAALALVLAACGGDDGGDGADAARTAPTEAEFCGAMTDYRADAANADPSDPTAYATALKTAVARLANVGTPDGVPAEARAGLDLTVSRVDALPEVATAEDLAALGEVDRAQRKQLKAFDEYVRDTCR
jgi:hypothetical protein